MGFTIGHFYSGYSRCSVYIIYEEAGDEWVSHLYIPHCVLEINQNSIQIRLDKAEYLVYQKYSLLSNDILNDFQDFMLKKHRNPKYKGSNWEICCDYWNDILCWRREIIHTEQIKQPDYTTMEIERQTLMHRKKLFYENYFLLKKFLPEMINTDPDFYFVHESENDFFITETVEQFDLGITRWENCICMGIFYKLNNEDVAISMNIIFDKELEMARVTNWSVDNPNVFTHGKFDEDYTCGIDEEEKTETEQKSNDYLNEWLKIFRENRQNNPNYFKIIYLQNGE